MSKDTPASNLAFVTHIQVDVNVLKDLAARTVHSQFVDGWVMDQTDH
jgi:hypothetical protein